MPESKIKINNKIAGSENIFLNILKKQNFSVVFLILLSILVIFMVLFVNFQVFNQKPIELRSTSSSLPQEFLISKPEGKVLTDEDLSKEIDTLEMMLDSELDIE
jgi:hypothetical protein